MSGQTSSTHLPTPGPCARVSFWAVSVGGGVLVWNLAALKLQESLPGDTTAD